MTTVKAAVVVAIVPLLMVGALQSLRADPFVASDPGVRGGPAGAGGRIPGLTMSQRAFFAASRIEFEGAEDADEGFGPRFNSDEANASVNLFDELSEPSKQNLLNFLRSL